MRVKGTGKIPRLCVFRSNTRMYVQLIDDDSQKSLAGVLAPEKGGKVKAAYKAGEDLAIRAQKMKIKRAIFDRGGYKFHGRVKAVLEGAQAKGLRFKKK